MPTAAEKSTSDLDQVKEHLSAIRDDFASLASATATLTANKAKKQARRAGEFAEDAAAQAATYRDAVVDKVKDHPLAAIGIAVLAGAILSSMGRRH
ncbi:MAG: hypothetical protein QM773_13865 [Hyphomonadaceae bacterium]